MCVNARWKCSTSDAVEVVPEQPYVSCCLVRSSAFRLYFHNYISVEIVFKVALKSESVWSRKQNFLRAAVASLTHRSALSPPSSYTVHGMCLLSLLDKQNTHRNRNISVIFFLFLTINKGPLLLLIFHIKKLVVIFLILCYFQLFSKVKTWTLYKMSSFNVHFLNTAQIMS